ncbi:PEP-CTERM sorting domain-containing protein [Telmatospirillum siberiense]|uniref:PEP-CTERM protein-sorting domain-containing protein n=1 Tax=Telmatospirillum siberiense TaxID=382514 RepID=A0A2N3PS75_9PROT|nr:PEP-CTERM sorting domain-containing protein [Telmatospirillum siberiense]PKU23261.1 hypothetical protein CWS72_17710 [Telmatospirillum siberiense]
MDVFGEPVWALTASFVLSALTIGATYQLSFLQWGDNEPGGSYWGSVAANGKTVLTYSGTDRSAGTNAGITRTVEFIAVASSETITFAETGSSGGASPIISDIAVSTVPSPGTLSLFGSGLIGFAGLCSARRRRKAQP